MRWLTSGDLLLLLLLLLLYMLGGCGVPVVVDLDGGSILLYFLSHQTFSLLLWNHGGCCWSTGVTRCIASAYGI